MICNFNSLHRLSSFLTLIALMLSTSGIGAELSTIAERSNWKRTGHYDEVIQLSDTFAKSFRGKIRTEVFGTTPEGRPMIALIVSQDGVLTPETARKRVRPVVYFQGGIHAGEIDGKDAGFWFLRDVLQGKILPGALSKVTLVFVPVFNVDGHERFGRNNRPNQIGPEEMGWRTTAQNLNLNRDFAKAEAPEMQALLAFYVRWDPILSMDLHVTDGAKFQHDISVCIEPTQAGPAALKALGATLEKQVMADLTAGGHLPVPFYPSLENESDPMSGFSYGVSDIRFSHAYWAVRNRIGVLVETHSWHNYEERVKATRDALVSLVGAAARDGAEWLKTAVATDREMDSLAGKSAALSYRATEKFRLFDFQGYEYRRIKSDVSDSMRVIYDSQKPQIWKVPLHDELKPRAEVIAPMGGYVIPAAHTGWIIPKLKLHGIRFDVIQHSSRSDVETFRATSCEFGKEPFEGKTSLRAAGSWKQENREIPAHSVFVPIAQPLGRLVLALFEPASADSFLSWGFFNGSFERKEYMEPYVTEEIAETMLRDSAIKKEFETKLAADSAFAKSPARRLEFFYRKHPAWDERYALYPVMRLSRAP